MFPRTVNFQVKDEAEAALEVMIKWCKDHDRSFNKVMEAILPAIAFCAQNYTRVDEHGTVTIELNLGTQPIKPTLKRGRKADPD
jgi:hypothetical protein